MATYTLDWSETDLGGSAVVSYGSGAILDFTDKPGGATSALSITSHQSDGVDNIVAEFSIETSGSSVMTFDYKVSTESGWDKFHIDVDGVSQAEYSGVVAWTSHAGINIASAGVHTIRFRYTKDSGGAGNADRIWVALLNITNTVTVNDANGTVDTYDMEDGALPAVVSTSTWINSTSEPITGSRSLRSPTSPANSGTYDITITRAASDRYRTLGFDYKVSSEAGWDKLFIFPDSTASNIPGTGSPSTSGESGWLEYSGSASGRLAMILPAASSSSLLRYTKDGGGASGSDAAWIDTLKLGKASGGASITPNDSSHGHAAESPAITQAHAITPADATSSHAADSPVITVVYAITPADSTHAHAADAATVTQVHLVTPADAAHAHAADAPAITQVHVVTPADGAHGHTAESPAVTTVGDIAPDDSSHGHTGDSPAVTQVHAIAPDDAAHAHAADSPAITSGIVITPADALHGHAADAPAVTQVHFLAPAYTIHAHTADAAVITQVHVIAPADSSHAHTVDSPTVTQVEPSVGVPAGRTTTVLAETRTTAVAAEARTTTVPAENRTTTL